MRKRVILLLILLHSINNKPFTKGLDNLDVHNKLVFELLLSSILEYLHDLVTQFFHVVTPPYFIGSNYFFSCFYAGLDLFQSQKNSFSAASQEIQAHSPVILHQNEVFMVPSFLAFIRILFFPDDIDNYSSCITFASAFVAHDDKFPDYPSLYRHWYC